MDGRQTTERFDVVVIGAGQAGLSAGHHLRRAGLSFVILEEHRRVGDNWRSRWESLRLYSPAIADGLPGMRFPARRTHFPSGVEMGDFLERYARDGDLPVRTGVHVDRLRRRADGADDGADGAGGYVIEAGDRRFEADQVIVATGGFYHPSVPAFASHLDPAIRQLHSSAYRAPSQLADGPVLVVGASHSGADIAIEAVADHPTYLAGTIHGQLPFPLQSRRARVIFPVLLLLASKVLTLRTPIGRRMAPNVRMGGGPLLRVRRGDLDRAGVQRFDGHVVGVRDGKPVMADGRTFDVATVVWCTGFRPDFGWIDGIASDPDGWPTQTRGVVPSSPGLYVLGLPFLYSFTSMLVAGAGRDAAYVVGRVADRARAGRAAGERGSTTATSPAA